MKVLVATKQTQGQRDNDFSFVPEDELVRFGSFECDHEIDGRCGCKRSMCGMKSRKATTTMKVKELPLGREQYEIHLRCSLAEAGWTRGMEPGKIDEIVKEEAAELLRIAAEFEVGMVIEKRGSALLERERGVPIKV